MWTRWKVVSRKENVFEVWYWMYAIDSPHYYNWEVQIYGVRSFKRGLCSFGQGCSVINKIVLPKLYCKVVEIDYYQYVKLIPLFAGNINFLYRYCLIYFKGKSYFLGQRRSLVKYSKKILTCSWNIFAKFVQ